MSSGERRGASSPDRYTGAPPTVGVHRERCTHQATSRAFCVPLPSA